MPRSRRFTDTELGPVVAYDAMQDPDACRVMLAAVAGQGDGETDEEPRSRST